MNQDRGHQGCGEQGPRVVTVKALPGADMNRRDLLSALGAAALPAAFVAEARPADSASTDSVRSKIARFIAIDNVCAWPNLTLLPGGAIIATIFNQPGHGTLEGDAECWASEDRGLTWRHRGTPTRHRPGYNRMNVGAGVTNDGVMVVLCSGWKVPPGTTGPLEATVSRSSDAGKTWKITQTMPPAVTLSNGVTSSLVPFGDVLTAANGDFVAGVYAHDWTPKSSGRNREGHVYVIRSKDGGMTWDEVTPIVKDIHVEAAMLHTGNGRWLAVSRRFGYLDLDVHASEDDAFTWRHEGTLGIPSTSAAHLLRLSDGRIALTYGNRSPGNGEYSTKPQVCKGAEYAARVEAAREPSTKTPL